MSTVPEKVVDQAQKLEKESEAELDQLVKEDFDTTDSNARYAAYATRLRTALRASHRYLAYSSEVGESFRPIVPPWIVTATYGVSWAYLAGDVGYETYKARKQGPTPLEAANFSEPARLALYASKRAVFQSVASMALPAFTVHSVVKYSAKAFVNQKNVRVRAWGPTLTGLAVVPLLPYMFDHPVEWVTDVVFDKVEHALSTVTSVPVAPFPPKPEL